MPTPLRLLIVEDSEDDTVLLLRELRRCGYDPSFLRVDRPEALQTALDQQTWDLIICDYSMPHFSGLAALKMYRESGLDIPFVVVSGTIGEDVAVNTMLAGAHDYIMKAQLSRLVPAIQRELREALERRARKQAEDALESAEAYSAQIITNTPVIICGITPDGTIRFINPAGEQITGYQADELVGQNAWQLFYPGENYRQVESLLRGFESGEVRDHELVLTTKSGEKRAILWNLTSQHDENGNLVEIVGFGSDITSRKQAEEALRASEEKYRTLFETSTDAIFVETMDGRILDCNERACSMHGYTKEEMLALSAYDLVPHEVYTVVIEDVSAQLAATGTAFFEAAARHKDGSVFPTEISVQMTTVGDDQFAVAYVRDITERRRVEKALQSYRDQLEELVRQRTTELNAANEHLLALGRVKDEFVSNVSHELRTPITNLKLHQYLLAADSGKFNEHLAVIKRETDRLAHIIDGLLHLSRLDQGRVPFNPVPINLNTLAHEYVLDRTPIAERKDLHLLFDGALAPPVVTADAGLLGQALSILLTNALNYTPSGGCVTVHTGTYWLDEQGWGVLKVSDTGPGIAPEEHPHLFERFFRGKIGLESGMPGTGLGLALAKEIVQLHQGRISVISDGVAGQGTTFVIELPLGEKSR